MGENNLGINICVEKVGWSCESGARWKLAASLHYISPGKNTDETRLFPRYILLVLNQA